MSLLEFVKQIKHEYHELKKTFALLENKTYLYFHKTEVLHVNKYYELE